jgi:integrase/recombinase XerD
MINLRIALADYLALRRGLGFKLQENEYLLRAYVAYLEGLGLGRLTTAMALAWARQSATASAAYQGRRLAVARGFAEYLHTLDESVEVPPVGLLVAHRERMLPHIYTDCEVASILAAASELTPTHRASTYVALFGLLASTGMRVGEAIRLDRADVKCADGVLTVRSSKFDKSREVLVHPTTAEVLRRYASRRPPRASTPAFFVSTVGTRLLYRNVHSTFRRLLVAANVGTTSTGRLPRLHDLRHSFAVNTVIRWYREGVDVQARLYLLSTYLGHYSERAVIPSRVVLG